DKRLPPSVFVFGFTLRGSASACRMDSFGTHPLAKQMNLSSSRVVVFFDPEGRAASAYAAETNGRRLDFKTDKGKFVDVQTKSTWSMGGVATDGPLKGDPLKPVDSARARWFAWSAAYPKTRLFKP